MQPKSTPRIPDRQAADAEPARLKIPIIPLPDQPIRYPPAKEPEPEPQEEEREAPAVPPPQPVPTGPEPVPTGPGVAPVTPGL